MKKKIVKMSIVLVCAFVVSLVCKGNIFAAQIEKIKVEQIQPIKTEQSLKNKAKKISLNQAEKIATSYMLDMFKETGNMFAEKPKSYTYMNIYDFNNDLCSYMFQYYDNSDKECGYFIIDAKDGDIVEFGSEYSKEIYTLAEYYKEKIDTNFQKRRIYYDGGYSYYISKGLVNNNSEIYACNYDNSSQNDTISGSSLIDNVKVIITNPEKYEKAYTGKTVKNVNGYNDFTIHTMDYWKNNVDSNLTNHCAPTAAVNLMRYYFDEKGYSELRYKSSWKTTFKRLYNLLGTSSSGTPINNIKKGYEDYIKGQGLKCTILREKLTALQYAKTNISNSKPLVFTLYSSSAYNGNHDVVALGYVTYSYSGSSSTYFLIADGWSKNFRYVHATASQKSIDCMYISISR